MQAQPAIVGAKLRLFAHVWIDLIRDPWTISTIQEGHRWTFKHKPPKEYYRVTRLPSSLPETRTSNQVYPGITAKTGNRRGSTGTERHRILFSSFLVTKKTDLRPLLDLKSLNETILVESF